MSIVSLVHRIPQLVRLVLGSWKAIDEEAAQLRQTDGPGTGTALYVFVIVTVSLILQQYLGGPDTFAQIVNFIDSTTAPVDHPFLYALVGWLKPQDGARLYYRLKIDGWYELFDLCYWASWRVLGFLVVPLVAIVVHPRIKLSDCGLRLKEFKTHLWIYLALFVPVLGMVIAVSFTEEFSTYYPFYSRSMNSPFDFWVWELFYFAQFFSLEFFFRGFMLQPLKRTMGSGAVFAMMLPYVMIHFGKPMLETFAAIFAGIILGTLALRTRSIWAGFLIHVSVALSMDIASNMQRGGIPWLLSILGF